MLDLTIILCYPGNEIKRLFFLVLVNREAYDSIIWSVAFETSQVQLKFLNLLSVSGDSCRTNLILVYGYC